MSECTQTWRDCPVNDKIESLQDDFDRFRDSAAKTHQKLFDTVNGLQTDITALKKDTSSIKSGVDKLVAWREAQDDKPNKLLDRLKENSIWFFLAAVLGVLWGRLGL